MNSSVPLEVWQLLAADQHCAKSALERGSALCSNRCVMNKFGRAAGCEAALFIICAGVGECLEDRLKINKYRSEAVFGSPQATGASTDAFGKYGVVRETDLDRCIL